MRVEEVRLPVFAVIAINVFNVGAHVCREELRDQEDEQAGLK